MPSSSKVLDGQNVAVTVSLPTTDVDLLTVNVATGVVTSPWLNAIQLANLRKAALAFFTLVPLAERTSVGFLNRLVSVTAFEDWDVSLSAATTGVDEQTLRATIGSATDDTHLVITLPHSITGIVATSGIGSGGGGGGGGGGNLLGDAVGPLLANTVERIRNQLIDPFLSANNTDKLAWDAGNGWWEAQSAASGGAYDVSSFIDGFPGAGDTIMQVRGVRNSRITRIKLWVDVPPAADADFLLTGSGGGSIAFTLPAFNTQVTATGSFTWFDNALLSLFAPAVQDVQMQGVRWTIEGTVL